MTRTFRVLLLSAACSLALQAHAQGSAGPTVPITIPAGDLTSALDTLARQSGTQLVYRSDQLHGARTGGVQAAPDADAALRRLLRGSGFSARHDATSGAVVIVRDDTPKRAPAPAVQADPPGGGAGEPAPPPAKGQGSLPGAP